MSLNFNAKQNEMQNLYSMSKGHKRSLSKKYSHFANNPHLFWHPVPHE